LKNIKLFKLKKKERKTQLKLAASSGLLLQDLAMVQKIRALLK